MDGTGMAMAGKNTEQLATLALLMLNFPQLFAGGKTTQQALDDAAREREMITEDLGRSFFHCS